MSKSVPVIVTCDVDPTPEVLVKNKNMAMEKTMDLFGEYDINATFFFVANVIKDYQSQIKLLLKQGHEIGCHGLSHDEQEEYNRLSESAQRKILTKASSMIHQASGRPVVSFRGPRVKTSHVTQKILEELDYMADSSVCSQRMDLFSSNLINTNWLFAPRLPYHPHINNAFRKGNRSLWVVPVSAYILPFVSGTLYTFGLSFMKMMFELFYQESRKTGKPIVYLLHPVEFAFMSNQRMKHYSISVEGFRFRRAKWLYESDEIKRYDLHRDFFRKIKTYPDVKFMSIQKYLSQKNNQ